MNSRHFAAVVIFIAIMSATACGFAASGHGQKTSPKVGILLVAFGSSQATAQVSFDNIARKVRAKYAGIPVRWAYTSQIIRRKLARQGRFLDSPQSALAKMHDEGFTHVAVQSLHTIAGSEFHDLRRTVSAYQSMGAFRQIVLGHPLMSSQQDMQRIVQTILDIVPQQRKPDEAVVLMGHGTHHPSNAFYAALMFQLQLKDPNIFVGTVEGFPEVGLIKDWLLKKKIQKAYLLPFMSVAGDHAVNDMAGDEEDSWKSVLSQAGIECVAILKGTAEFDGFVDIWVAHLEAPLSQFN